jgi:hypothetical protein
MSKEYWKEVLTTARKTLTQLRDRRDELDAEREEVNLEIVQLEQVVANLVPLVPEGMPGRLPRYRLPTEIKLTDACREVLKKSDKHITPIEIRNALETGGYDLSQHANALASIHGVLKRLVESGEAEPLSHELRGTMYRWKSQGTQFVKQPAGGAPLRRTVQPVDVSPPVVAPRLTREQAAIKAEERDLETLRRRVPPIKTPDAGELVRPRRQVSLQESIEAAMKEIEENKK